MRAPTWLVWVVWCGTSLAAAPPAHPDIGETLKTRRQIDSAVLRGEADPLRIGFQDQARNRPGDVMLRIFIAWCYGASDEAWNQLKGIASTQPENAWVHFGMGRIYLKWKMRDQAKNEFLQALKYEKGFFPAVTGLGEVARASGDFAGAEAKFREALALKDDAEAHAGLGLTLAAQEKTAPAKQELEKAVALWPDQPEALNALTALARKAGDLTAAAASAEKLAALAPKDVNARKTLADLRFEAGDKAGAAKEYERLLRQGGVDGEVLKRLAGLYREVGNGESEERTLQQLSALEKQEPAHPLRMAELAEARGAQDEAEAQLLEASDRAPNRVDTLVRLARLRAKRGNLREALESFRAAQLATEGEKPPELAKEAAALEEQFKLPKKPVKGTVDQIYARVSSGLNALYAERLKEHDDLAGLLKIRVRVEKDGKVMGVDLLEDSVNDPVVAGHVYFALKDAQYPKQKREPVFEFELKPPKKEK